MIKIASLNCLGISKKLKRKTIFKQCLNYDVICLQETHITHEKYKEWKLDWNAEFFYTVGTNFSKGQIILINPKLKYKSLIVTHETPRILGVKITLENDLTIQIFNIYAPNTKQEKLDFINKLYSTTQSITSEHFLLCGDFNIVLNNDLDIISGKPHDMETVEKFKNWTLSCELVDTWRQLHSQQKDFTWARPSPFVARRLDYILCNNDLSSKLVKSKHEMFTGTDHKAVISCFQTDSFQHGKSYWKFNDSLLHDISFVNMMNGVIDDFLMNCNGFDDASDRWEILKTKIKENSIIFSISKKNILKSKETEIEQEINSLNLLINADPSDEVSLKQYLTKKRELEIIQIDKTRGAAIRSRAKWIEEGEKNKKYFLNLEKSRASSNTITSLNSETSSDNPLNLLKTIKNHFQNIYKKDNTITNIDTGINEFLQNCDFPILDNPDKDQCDTPLTIEEIDKSLKSLNNDSSPGIDGITTSFMKFFWVKLRTPVLQSFQHSFETGQLSTSQKRGVISLIHKGKDLSRYELKNWRPITITNTDYKILSKCLASRLQKVIASIVSSNQSGFIKGRNICHHIRSIDDITCYSSIHNLPGMLVSLDFAKAFDTVEKEMITTALKTFNFGENFIKMIKTLITDTESCIKNGGWLSSWFKTERGVKQGCCVSPLLFVIVVELMAIKIRNNHRIQGLRFDTPSSEAKPFKILQYADDTTLILKTENELLAALADIHLFSSFSGLKLNKSKSQGMWIGSSKFNTNTPGDISWVKCGEMVKILGIFFCATKEASDLNQNWDSKIDQIRKLICRWQRRQLSLYGKILICKTFLISQLAYSIQALVPSEEILNTIDSLLFKFIWQKKYSNKKAIEKIKRKVICQPIEKGGLSMISVKTQAKLFHLKLIKHTLLSNMSNENKQSLTECIFKNLGGFDYFLSFSNKLKETDLPKTMTRFWKSVLVTWSEFRYNEETTENDSSKSLLTEPLFFNKHISFKEKSLFFPPWVHHGVKYMFQFMEQRRWKSKAEIEETVNRYANLHFEYYALLNGISSRLKTACISQEEVFTSQHEFSETHVIRNTLDKSLKLLDHSNAILRQKLSGENVEICGRNFWKRKTGYDISPNFRMASVATKESRLRLLHFKILHNIYPSNLLLKKMGIKNSDMCEFCKERDLIEHMLINCKLLNGFWSKVYQVIYNYTSEQFQMTDDALLFGYNYESVKVGKDKINTANHILLIAKLSISKFRYGQTKNINIIFDSEMQLRSKFFASNHSQ